jgi:hypothetical protein
MFVQQVFPFSMLVTETSRDICDNHDPRVGPRKRALVADVVILSFDYLMDPIA